MFKYLNIMYKGRLTCPYLIIIKNYDIIYYKRNKEGESK